MFKMTVITPGQASTEQVRTKLLNAMRKNGNMMLKDYESTTDTWSHHDVKFGIGAPSIPGRGVGGALGIFVGPVGGTVDDRGKSSIDIWNWLNKGTSVRRAILAPNFSPKTVPGRIRSGSGQSPEWVKARMAYSFPGIEPRNWNELIWIKNKDAMYANIQRAIEEGMKQFVAQANAGAKGK